MTYQNTFKSYTCDQRGGVAIAFALALLPMLAAAGGAVDYSMAVRAKSQIQAIVDSAVLAGARQSDAAGRADVAGKFASSLLTASPGLSSPGWQFSDTADGQFTGTVNAHVATSLLGVIGINTIAVEATATAGLPKGGSKVCILLLDPSRSQSLLLNSGVNLTAPDCEIHTRSTAAPAAVFNAGNTLNVKNICVKGNNVLNNAGTVPGLQTGCNAIADPFVNKLPSMSSAACTYNSNAFNPGNVTLTPGVYCGYTNFNGSGTITLSPGVYVIKGGAMTFNSGRTVVGDGVTFYLADAAATLTFNGNVQANLKAPTSGTYADILFYEPNGLALTPLVINGTTGSSFQGLMYLPSRNVTVNSVSNAAMNGVTMVFNSLILNQINWKIESSKKSMSTGGGSDGGISLVR